MNWYLDYDKKSTRSVARLGLSLAIWLFFLTPYVTARNPLQPGVELKGRAGLGAVAGRGEAVLFHNPALLKAQKTTSVTFELSTILLDHTYQNENVEPFSLKLFVPMAFLGVKKNFANTSIGFAAYPTGSFTEEKIEGVPVDLTPNDPALSYITATQGGYDAAFGISQKIIDGLTLGASVIQMYRSTSVKIEMQDPSMTEAPDPFIEGQYSGLFHRFIVGGKLSIGKVNLGTSYSVPTFLEYEGQSKPPELSADETYDVQTIEYSPAIYNIGLGYQHKKGLLAFEYSLEQHSTGRHRVTTGMSANDVKETILLDSHNFSLSNSLRISRRSNLTFGAGYFMRSVGEGDFPGLGGKENLGSGGMRFGTFEGISRYVGGTSFEFNRNKQSQFKVGASIEKGSVEVSPGKMGQGTYDLLVGMLHFSYSQEF